MGLQLGSFLYLNHRTKSQGSAFLKRDGNIKLHVYATFTFCGNVLYHVLAILSSFRHVSGTVMSSYVSVIFKSKRFRCCSFPLCFCKRSLNIPVEFFLRKQTDRGFVRGFYYIDEFKT